MSPERQPRSDGTDWEEPPPVERAVAGAIGTVATGVGAVVRGVLTRMNRGLLFAGIAVMTVVIFLAILTASIVQNKSLLEGVLGGLFAGLFMALLFALGSLLTVLWALGPKKTVAPTGPEVTELDTLLAPTLRELAVVRTRVAEVVRARSRTRVPAAIATAIVLWVLMQTSHDPPGVFGLLMYLLIGAVGGELWAQYKPAQEYKRLYKSRVLPMLASRFGQLTYRPATVPDLHMLHANGVFGDYDREKAEDEIAGTYRGLPLRIVELELTKNAGKDKTTAFDGLLIELVLPRRLTGTTVIAPEKGAFAERLASLRRRALEPVRLEDPTFEKHYSVFSTDQIEARALLTPAFMERFTRLASSSHFSLPGALADGNRLVTALPKQHRIDLFEPPVYWKRAGGRALVELSDHIASVLKMADAVINLDFWASGTARDVDGQGVTPAERM